MNRKSYVVPGLAIAFAAFLVGVIGMADTSTMGKLHEVYDLPYGDKVGHVVLNGLLTFLVGLAALQLRPGDRRIVLRCSLVIALLMTLEEASQVFVPVRTPDIFDLSATYVGIVCGTLAALTVDERLFGRRKLAPAGADATAVSRSSTRS